MMLFPRFLILSTLAFSQFTASLNITRSKPHAALAPSPLPPSHAHSDGEAIITAFQTLGRTTPWTWVQNITFEGDTYEPEGIVRLGADRYIVSAGEYTAPTVPYNKTINGTDRTAGAGFAHLIVFGGDGSRIADATVTREGDIEYHNGGLDWDGENLWGAIAQYRPNSTAYVYKADPTTLEPKTVVHYDDHLGGVVHDKTLNSITALNWGSRNATTWHLHPHSPPSAPATPVRNPSFYIDYQDCKFLGHSPTYSGRPIMLCGGVSTLVSNGNVFYLGGIALVDVEMMVPVSEVPITLTSARGVPLTQNPIDASVSKEGSLRLYLLPDQRESTLYVIEASG
ncbi:uncharacterized protein LTR77_006350 [Saxophila tyrrhenica]|uniref:Uncharacterized protein n=1 Tax=Saxophila tyrrhenica TaxID=1690608 RepID=A0AAV9P9S1_9PEZI|nr:hypothetical protein LTR77_006350 [Saxophila tyrrhenica]